MAARQRKATRDLLPFNVRGGLSLEQRGHSFLSSNRLALLEAIATHGSISRAAKAIGMSYKGAWDAVDAMNNLAEEPLVIRATGGKHGGGSQLTDFGRRTVELYRQLSTGHDRVLTRMQAEIGDPQRLSELLQVLTLKTSARNQLRGVVKSVRKGAVNAEVLLALGDGLEIVANITNEAVRELGLKRGRAALALIKASFVLLSPDSSIRISARNRLPGIIERITPGAVNSEVTLRLAGGRTMVAIVTAEGLAELGLKRGSVCCAIVKSSHVLLAVND
jgi:molybdate transport system regulatory protein